ncbi:MAG: tetratricopeptide repeat protein [Syntrophobacteraceae bacterium]
MAEEFCRLLQSTGKSRVPEVPVVSGLVSGSRGRCVQGMLLVLVIAIAFSACERKQVSVPPEYSSPPPAPPSYSGPQPAASTHQQAEPVTKAPEITTGTAVAPVPLPAPPVKKKVEPKRAPTPADEQQAERSKKQEPAKSPQGQASMQKVNQARGQLERGRPDSAIRTLEGAIRIDARNGEAFILLAKAWKQKGEKRKALEFAKKAELLYQKQPAKLKEVFLLESDLYRELGDSAKAAALRQKASGVRQKPSE